MVQPYLGALMPLPYATVPRGWSQCNGQLLSIQQNAALFALLGTFYGGNGTNNFALPDLRGRTPISFSSTIPIGTIAGQEAHGLTIAEMPSHAHSISANGAAATLPKVNASSPGVTPGTAPLYGPATQLTTMNPGFVGTTGGSQPHENRQPFLTINWVIALVGIFPSRN